MSYILKDQPGSLFSDFLPCLTLELMSDASLTPAVVLPDTLILYPTGAMWCAMLGKPYFWPRPHFLCVTSSGLLLALPVRTAMTMAIIFYRDSEKKTAWIVYISIQT